MSVSATHSPSLQRTWARFLAMLVALVVGLGAIALAATQYQRVMFNRTTSDLQDKTGAVDELERSVLEAYQLTIGVLYKVTPQQRAEVRVEYDAASEQVHRAFEQAAGAMAGTPLAERVHHANELWLELDRAVATSETKWADGTVIRDFQAGVDPFADTVWARVFALTAEINQLGAASVAALDDQVAEVNRIQLLIGPMLLLAVVLTLAMGSVVGRRMKRRVLSPLLELRRAAVAMRSADTEQVVEIPGASQELQDLAATLNETSRALSASHHRLQEDAHTDVLCGLRNRRAFVKDLHGLLAEPDAPVGVLFIDLDDFKIVNDSLGHAAGDELLRVVGERLRSSVRQGELVARLGGDEFAIAVPRPSSPDALARVAERTLSVLENPVALGGTTVSVRCSIGIARSEPGDGPEAADELMRNADFAMYMAKGQGKSCYEVFQPAMRDEVLSRTELKRDLSKAVGAGELRLDYQPVLDLASGSLLGFEALVRWEHPQRGLIGPGEFIPTAEDTGDIVAIGEWVLDQACATLAAMHRETPDGERPFMSVNASPRQLAGHGLVEQVESTLTRHGLLPTDLIIELTEGAAVTTTAEAATTLQALRQRGVRIALDDFGTGYSSLRWLSELPVDVVKIDRSFVMREGVDSESMLETIVNLGQRLGLRVIAEGIELPWELERLRRLGADGGQGFLLARPMPAEMARAFGPEPATALDPV